MWIRWRQYARKGTGKLDGETKYKVQPILMATKRMPKAMVIKRLMDTLDIPEADAAREYELDKEYYRMPRQVQVYRFPTFSSCDYVHLYEPPYIENRIIYWWMLEKWRSGFVKDEDCDKILDEIDTLLPRPDKKSFSILYDAYENGMPIHYQIKKYGLLDANKTP
jgi:hypothetical protein